MSTDTDKIIEILLILFLPPLAVWYHARACTCHTCLNILLFFPFVLPSVIHAIWYCYMRDKEPTTVTITVPAPSHTEAPAAMTTAPPAYSEK